MQTNKTHLARIGAVVLATTCVGAGAVLAASPAHADAPVPNYGGVVGIQKVDSQHGAPLSGATLRVCAPASDSPHDMTGGDFSKQRDRYQAIADQASLATYQNDLAEIITDANDRLARAEASLLDDATLARWKGLIAAHEAAIAAAQPYNDAITAADAERQRLADQIIALQEANAGIPAEIAAAHAAAQEAQSAAIAAAAPYNDAVKEAFDAKFGADEAIAAHNTAARDAELARASLAGAQASLDNAASTWDGSRYDTFAEMARRMQAALDSQGNLHPEAVGDLNCFTQTTGSDGTIFVPISTNGGYYTVAELTAPEGYQRFEGTATVTISSTGSYNDEVGKFTHSYSQTSDTAALTPGGDVTLSGTGESGGVALDATLTNEKIVEEEPAPAPASQPELPRTGADTSRMIALGGIGTLLASAGAAMAFHRRKTI